MDAYSDKSKGIYTQKTRRLSVRESLSIVFSSMMFLLVLSPVLGQINFPDLSLPHFSTFTAQASSNPNLTLFGSSSVTLNVGDSYSEPGFAADDAEDGDLTSSVVVTGTVNTSTAGTYAKTYKVTDTDGNSVTKTRTIVVQAPPSPAPTAQASPNTAPNVVLLGNNPLNLTCGQAFTEPGFGADDNEDGDLTSIVVINNPTNSNQNGSYSVTYSVTDSAGASAQATRTVNVSGCSSGGGSSGGGSTNTAPNVVLLGNNPLNLTCGQAFTEPGFGADDNEDGDLTSLVSIHNPTNVNANGSYSVTYRVTDRHGASAQAVRTVNVSGCSSGGGGGGGGGNPGGGGGGTSNTQPTLVLKGQGIMTINTCIPYNEPGYIAHDKEDGFITHKVKVTGTVPTGVEGTYGLTYEVTDSGGKTVRVVRTVHVRNQGTCQCGAYLTDFLRAGLSNDRDQVLRLQAFLRTYEGFNVSLTGVYDAQTIAAVDAFQMRYFSEILEPWGHTGPTSFVYITTRNKINEILCGEDIPYTSAQLQEMNSFRELLRDIREGRVQGVDLPIVGQHDNDTSGDGLAFEPGTSTDNGASTTTPPGSDIDTKTPLQSLASAVYSGLGSAADFIFSGWFIILLIIIAILFLLYKLTKKEDQNTRSKGQ